MKLKLGPEIISSYKRLAYKPWYALAEFVDNSTQAYFNNRSILNRVYAKTNTKLTVEIFVKSDAGGNFIRIEDNSIGMSESELRNAVVIGKPPSNTSGRSKYGLGLKTGACWFGDLWSIKTKKLGDRTAHEITINVPRIASDHLTLPYKAIPATPEEHYTVIEIRKLHRNITGRTAGKVKDHLRSLYRVDIRDKLLVLKWNDEILTWDFDIDKKLITLKNGQKAKKKFKFRIGQKRVSGWAGVLAKGTRREAGFSIIQAGRVITGWPDSYRPGTLYGFQEGGSNDLVNQRLLGELLLEGFDVSHTKDQILFDDADQESLDLKLKVELAGLRKLALTYRKGAEQHEKQNIDSKRAIALNRFDIEIRSSALQSFLKTYELPRASLIRKSNDSLKNAIVRRFKPDLVAKINKLEVSLYLVRDMSPNDPYVLIESTESETSVIVIMNLVHPHWSQLTNAQSILNFIRHCTYDGVSEWKAYFATGKIEPDTVKLIKDNLLRIPMKVQDSL